MNAVLATPVAVRLAHVTVTSTSPARGGRDSAMEVGVMPKDLVYSRETLRGEAATAVVEHVAVGWTKDCHVQIGVVNGPSVQMSANGAPLDPGLWMDLDREQINRLVRSLRKARDQAFGADA